MIDFHCHLDLYPEPREIARECAERGIYLLSVTNTPSAWIGTSAIAHGLTRIQTGIGLHPQLAHQRKGEIGLFERLLGETSYVGEIGLDGAPEFRKHWNDQVEVFDRILQLCSGAGGRIMSIHSRRATSAVLDHLEKHRASGPAVLHWFSGTSKELIRAVGLGCWFSVGPATLASEKGRDLVSRMPKDRILTESDGPFVQVGGSRLFPWDVRQAIAELARTWSVDVPAARRQISDNLRRLVRQSSIGPAKVHQIVRAVVAE